MYARRTRPRKRVSVRRERDTGVVLTFPAVEQAPSQVTVLSRLAQGCFGALGGAALAAVVLRVGPLLFGDTTRLLVRDIEPLVLGGGALIGAVLATPRSPGEAPGGDAANPVP